MVVQGDPGQHNDEFAMELSGKAFPHRRAGRGGCGSRLGANRPRLNPGFHSSLQQQRETLPCAQTEQSLLAQLLVQKPQILTHRNRTRWAQRRFFFMSRKPRSILRG
jgi:hypothetical protein